jgi:hypothetical protein
MTVTVPPTTENARRTRLEFHEIWTCGNCGRSFDDCTSCCAHEAQCGGHLSHC